MTSQRFDRLFGRPPRRSGEPLEELDFDLAASVQQVTEEIVLRALEKRPEDRFPSAEDMLTALASLDLASLDGRPEGTATTVRGTPQASATTGRGLRSPTPRATTERRVRELVAEARRLLSGGGVRHGGKNSAEQPQQKRNFSHLTQQEISDADFEEIP